MPYCLRISDPRAKLFFVKDVGLYASGWFAVQCEAVGMKVTTSISEDMAGKTVDRPIQVGIKLLPQMKEFKYIWVFDHEGRYGGA